MDNSINNVTFQAKLKPLAKIKNKSAFMEVSRMFNEGTQANAGAQANAEDILVITKQNHGNSLYVSSKNIDPMFANEIYVEDINKQLESIGAKQLANKLISDYKALLCHYEGVQVVKNIKSQIARAKTLLRANTSIVEACRTTGKDSFARRYDFLAINNQQKIDMLADELKSKIDKYTAKLNKLAANDCEIHQLDMI